MTYFARQRQFGSKQPKTAEQIAAAKRAEQRKTERRASLADVLREAFARIPKDGADAD
jgi:hypothetical protein